MITKKKTKESEKVHTSNDGVKRGYNEKNPTQPQGAFKPDAAKKTPAPKKKSA